MNAPVSVILPTFNRLRYLRPAIDSVLAQTFDDWEMVIADDGSTEEARNYLRSVADPRVRIVWLSHSGNPSRARNAAVRAARGKYVAFLDSDDLWAPSKLEKQLALMRQRPDCGWSYTHCESIDEDGQPIRNERLKEQIPGEGWILQALLETLGYQIAIPAVLADRQLVEDVGAFDEQQRWCEDADLWFRLAMRSPIALLAEPLCAIRAHSEHHSGDRIGEYESRVRLYGKMAGLISDPPLRSLCRRMRARHSLTLAGLQGDRKDNRAVWRTLARSTRFSWSYPTWWMGAFKAVARPLVPEPVLLAYRERRARR